jgi:predicted RNA methylase
MFNKNFYPTPDWLVKAMLLPYYQNGELYLRGKNILEPSAGKGNIIDFITNNTKSRGWHHSTPRKIYACEIDGNLQTILQTKSCKIIGSDFLTTPIHRSFDLIVMNPPFDNGAKHLLKAWEILKDGEIVCLLNEETLKNPYTEERKLLNRIIEENGEVEYLGDCFKDAERTTGVHVAMVRLFKKAEQKKYFDNCDFDKAQFSFPKDLNENQIAVRDILKNYENHYKASIVAFNDAVEAWQRFRYISQIFRGRYGTENWSENVIKGTANGFLDDFTETAWQKILDESKFTTYLTSKVRDEFVRKFERQKDIAYTKDNMLMMFDVLFLNKDKIMNDCLVEVFERMTSYDDKNKIHIEGWKTNDNYKVNEKVILPYFIKYNWLNWNSYDLKRHGAEFQVNYHYETTLLDIDKAICYIKGTKIENIRTIKEALSIRFKNLGKVFPSQKYDNECESTFFKIRFFKKGTLHIQFKDKFLWQEFNRTIAKIKGFPLPDETRKGKTYKMNF